MEGVTNSQPLSENTFKNSQDHIILNASMQKLSIDDIPRSDALAANIRGLDGPTKPEKGKFVYTKCLDKNRKTLNTLEARCTDIRFDISRYGQYTHTIGFAIPISVRQAIKAVEEYLSEPLTQEYYDKIKDDLFCDGEEWEEAKKYFKCKGDCLTDCKFLEEILFDDTIAVICCGS